jgi:peptidoglycan/xylan/chitin deacetylase (PgdA/CDA1 family)
MPPRRALLVIAGLVVLTGCDGGGQPPPHAVPKRTAPPTTDPSTGEDPTHDTCPPSGPAPQYHVNQGPKAIALTIDDGPDPRYTPEVLEILAEHRIAATFCMVGRNAAAHRDLVGRISDAGHEIANHTWSHPNDLAALPVDQVQQEIEQANQTLEDASGSPPVFFRAPGGAFTPAALAVCARLGLQPLAWSVDPHDWKQPGSARIVDTVLHTTRTGSIILNHDGGGDRSQTVAALRTYLPQLLDAGYRFVTPSPTATSEPSTEPCP